MEGGKNKILRFVGFTKRKPLEIKRVTIAGLSVSQAALSTALA